jgi:predicted nucleotidyltransferase
LKKIQKKYRIDQRPKESLVHTLADYLQTQRQGVVFAYIFGSFVKNDGFSDIDVGVYLLDGRRNALDFELRLETELEGIIKYPMDVRILNFAPISFAQRVIKTGMVILDRNPCLRADFEGLTLKKYFDFSMFRKKYLHEVRNAPV